MGYDMHWTNDGDSDEGYFRLNISGMDECRRIMDDFGMLDFEHDHLPFPSPTTYGLDWEKIAAIEDGEQERTAAYESFTAAATATIEGDRGGPIPAYKLGSNDGWLVTPDEIRRSLEAYEAHENPNAVLTEYDEWWQGGWKSWVTWLRGAATTTASGSTKRGGVNGESETSHTTT